MLNFFEKLPRRLLGVLAFWLPAARRRRLERWLRGWEQSRKLARADVVVVSFGKSGRTWVRMLLSRYYQRCYGLSERSLLGFDNLHRRRRAIPRIFFTHDNYIQDYTGHRDSKRDFYGKRVVLLVRNPQDVAVSQYFQWRYRMKPAKKALNDYPDHEMSMFDFVMSEEAGLPKVLRFLDVWAREAPRVADLMLLRYEDLRRAPEETFRALVRFVGGPDDADAIAEAVRYASVENMRALEQRRFFWRSGGRMKPRDRANPDSYKVRRAKVGGYRDYFDDAQCARIDALVRERLSPFYGYGGEAPARGAAGAPGGGA
jgi:hypothetical protein